MKIALAQFNYHTGNFEDNTNKIITALQEAKEQNADLVVFSELCVCGYPPRDFLEFKDFIQLCEDSIQRIAKHCTNGLAAIVGAPSVNPQVQGKDLFNSAYFLSDGKVLAIRHKTLLPTYDVFDEYRYFEPNKLFDIVSYKGKKIAVTICEDLWNINDNPLYTVNPMDELLAHQPELIINIAASPFATKQTTIREQVLKDNVLQYKVPLIYVNHVGAQTELIFDGGSMAINSQGDIVNQLPYFEEAIQICNLSNLSTPVKNAELISPKQSSIGWIHDALVLGIKDYFRKLNFKKAILGLSGGIDSAVVLALAAEALGAENVQAILMPSRFSSDHSVNDAEQLANNLGTPHEIISIEQAFNTFEQILAPSFEGQSFDITEENMQSRCRAVLLMAFSNKFGHILLNTSNKSELAVGYGTLYGDMCGGLSVIGDLYKTEVFDLARYINRDQEIIPENIITKPPSAELREDQKDIDSLPPYEILDAILRLYIDERHSAQEIASKGFEQSLVTRILRLVNINEYKRHQTPPILRVSHKAFGMGRRVPIVAKYLA